ncbi:TonB family protein [Sphingobium boeckii]|uniref:TonB family protein n=1 Tax=Sphingobium boeckii TaxID=1082345 RepID=A0A7W9ALU4_9SPHN|nr:TonB family protein [Sphingobium boeckii]
MPAARDAGRGAIVGLWIAIHISRFPAYPPAARYEELEGTVSVPFRVNREGKVLSAELHRSLGYSALDEEALQSVLRAQPMPVMPVDRPDEVAPVAFRIEA